MRFTKMGILAAAIVSLCGFTSGVRADSIDPLDNLQESVLGAGQYQYQVTFEVTGTSTVTFNPADFFSLINLVGTITNVSFASPILQPWTNGSSGSTILFTYAGASDIPGQQTLGTLTFDSDVDYLTLPMVGDIDGFGDPGQVGGVAKYLNNNTGLQAHNGIALTVALPVPAAVWSGSAMLVGLGAMAALKKRVRLA